MISMLLSKFSYKKFDCSGLIFESSTLPHIDISVILKFPSSSLMPYVEVQISGCLLNPLSQKRIAEELIVYQTYCSKPNKVHTDTFDTAADF